MGFKITHPLLPSRLLVWPLWHTSAWRQHVPLDRMSGTSDTTKWPQCLHFHFVLVVFLISASHRLPHLFPCFKVDVFSIPFFSFLPPVSRWLFYISGYQIKFFFFLLPLSSSVCLHPELLFIFMLLSVYWFLSVFECHYTCGPPKLSFFEVYFVYHPSELISLCFEHMHSAVG